MNSKDNAVYEKSIELWLEEIKKRVSTINPWKVIVFGSAIKETAKEESDIDIVVILNKSGLSKDYSELLKNKAIVSKTLRDIRKKIPIDLLVFTREEWESLKNSGSTFFTEIEKKGRIIA